MNVFSPKGVSMKPFGLALFLTLGLIWTGGAWAQDKITSGTSEEPALLGSYLAEPFTVEELALQGMDKGDVCGNTGTWKMDLRPAGWSLDNYPVPGCIAWNPPIVGSWRLLENNVIAIRELQDLGCSPDEFTYTWKLEGDTLTFSVVDDPCLGRIHIFTDHPWKKIPEGAQPTFR